MQRIKKVPILAQHFALLKEDKFVDIVSGTVRKSVFLKKVKLISGVVVHLGSSIRECPRSYRRKKRKEL